MADNKKRPEKKYHKPVAVKIILDKNFSLWLMSEGTIPDPPWVNEANSKPDPYGVGKG